MSYDGVLVPEGLSESKTLHEASIRATPEVCHWVLNDAFFAVLVGECEYDISTNQNVPRTEWMEA